MRADQAEGQLVGHRRSVQCLSPLPSFAPDSALLLVSGAADGFIRVWDPTRSSQAVQCVQIASCDESVNSVIGVGDHHLYAAAGPDLYRVDRRRAQADIVFTADDEINQIAVRDYRMAWCDDAGALTLARILDGGADLDVQRCIESAHDNIATSVLVRPGDPTAGAYYTGGMDSMIRVWDAHGDEIECVEASVDPTPAALYQPSMVQSLSCSGDGGLLAAALQTADIILGDTNTFAIGRLHAHTSTVTNVHFAAFNPGHVLVSASSDSTVVVWDLDPGARRQVLDSDCRGFNAAERQLFDTDLIQRRIRLAYKPNDITTSVQGRVYVADTSPYIHVYNLL